MIGGGIDSYNLEPSACRYCNRTRRNHSVFTCSSPTRKWEMPPDWLIKARMQVRKGDRLRWASRVDGYAPWFRKWATGLDPE